MEQIIVIILFYQDHLLHKNREERGKGTWPRIGMEHYPTGDIYLLASCSACEILTGWEPASHHSAHGLLRQRLGVLLLLCGPFYLPACLSCTVYTFVHVYARTYLHSGSHMGPDSQHSTDWGPIHNVWLSSSISQKFAKSTSRGSGRPQLCPGHPVIPLSSLTLQWSRPVFGLRGSMRGALGLENPVHGKLLLSPCFIQLH